MTPTSERPLDIRANRAARKWTTGELARRAAWETIQPLFAWSPRQAWGWRNLLLRMFGATLGGRVRIHPTVRIAIPWNLRIGDDTAVGDGAILYDLGEIVLGPQVTVSQYAHLCAGTHDYRRADLPLTKARISVGRGAWVCADAFVGPDVQIGEFAIIGARGVVVADVEAWAIVAGNPARVVGRRPMPEPA